MKQKRPAKKQDSAGVHLWLVLMKAFQALLPHAAGSIKRTELGDSDFRILEVLLHKGPLPGCGNRSRPVLCARSEEHTSELQSQSNLVCRLLLEKKKKDIVPRCQYIT